MGSSPAGRVDLRLRHALQVSRHHNDVAVLRGSGGGGGGSAQWVVVVVVVVVSGGGGGGVGVSLASPWRWFCRRW